MIHQRSTLIMLSTSLNPIHAALRYPKPSTQVMVAFSGGEEPARFLQGLRRGGRLLHGSHISLFNSQGPGTTCRVLRFSCGFSNSLPYGSYPIKGHGHSQWYLGFGGSGLTYDENSHPQSGYQNQPDLSSCRSFLPNPKFRETQRSSL